MTNDACPTVPYSPSDPDTGTSSKKDGKTGTSTGGSKLTGGTSSDKQKTQASGSDSTKNVRMLESDDDDILVRRLNDIASAALSQEVVTSVGARVLSTKAYPWPIPLPTGVCTPLKM
jgi:hypothetical protein